MDDQAFHLIISKITMLEVKVDELLAFKHYFVGVSAAVAAVISAAFSYFR